MEFKIKKSTLKHVLFIIAPLLVFVLIVGATTIFKSFSKADKEYRYLSLFSEVLALIKTDYVEDVEPGDKFPGAFSGMLGAVDRFSAYLDTRSTEIYDLYRLNRAFTPGIYGVTSSGYFYITDVIPGSSADNIGLKPGDVIKAVNGKSIFGLSYWQMYLSLLSDKKETVEAVIMKSGSSTPEKAMLQTLPLANANGSLVKEIKKNTYHLNLSRIDITTVEKIEKKLKETTIGTQPLKLILDLRKYSGGDLDALIRLTRLFFSEQISLDLKMKNQKEIILLGARPEKDRALNYQAAVIVNESTIMYGELLAVLFKYTKAAKVVGRQTNGFISRLRHIPLTDGSSILLTDGFFLLDGKNPARSGVEPDVSIDKENFADIIDQSVSILERTNTGKIKKKTPKK